MSHIIQLTHTFMISHLISHPEGDFNAESLLLLKYERDPNEYEIKGATECAKGSLEERTTT